MRMCWILCMLASVFNLRNIYNDARGKKRYAILGVIGDIGIIIVSGTLFINSYNTTELLPPYYIILAALAVISLLCSVISLFWINRFGKEK